MALRFTGNIHSSSRELGSAGWLFFLLGLLSATKVFVLT